MCQVKWFCIVSARDSLFDLNFYVLDIFDSDLNTFKIMKKKSHLIFLPLICIILLTLTGVAVVILSISSSSSLDNRLSNMTMMKSVTDLLTSFALSSLNTALIGVKVGSESWHFANRVQYLKKISKNKIKDLPVCSHSYTTCSSNACISLSCR